MVIGHCRCVCDSSWLALDLSIPLILCHLRGLFSPPQPVLLPSLHPDVPELGELPEWLISSAHFPVSKINEAQPLQMLLSGQDGNVSPRNCSGRGGGCSRPGVWQGQAGISPPIPAGSWVHPVRRGKGGKSIWQSPTSRMILTSGPSTLLGLFPGLFCRENLPVSLSAFQSASPSSREVDFGLGVLPQPLPLIKEEDLLHLCH